MAKSEAEYFNSLSIFWLKKHGYLDGGYKQGGIKWTYGLSGNESSIGFTVITNIEGEEDHIKLQYTYTDRRTDKKEILDYNVGLTTTPCNYGGVRYWFICPLSKNGQYCGRRVGVLYCVGKYFGCRHCGELTYRSRNLSGYQKASGRVISIPELEQLEKEVKRQYYAGKMTRKYKRFLQKNQKSYMQLITITAALNKRLDRSKKFIGRFKNK